MAEPALLTYVTSSPVYLERSNSSIIHAALDLSARAPAHDAIGTSQTTVAMLRHALRAEEPVVVVAADVRGGLPGSEFEWFGCDAAAAVALAPEGTAPAVARHLGGAATTLPVGDTWMSTEDVPKSWDGRFAAHALIPETMNLAEEVLARYGDPARVQFVVSASNRRLRADVIRRGRKLGWAYLGGLTDDLGYAGAADPLLVMAAAFDVAAPGSQILVLTVADGASAHLWEIAEGVESRSGQSLKAQVDRQRPLAYPTYLRWRGDLAEDPPRRPEPDRVSAPAALRNRRWKYALVGADCGRCQARNVPAQRICGHCRRPAPMRPVPLQDTPGTIRSWTVDHLAYSKGDKVIAAVVDLDGGGRLSCEVADAHGERLAPGQRVIPTFRRISTSDGLHNYFWKVRPLQEEVN
ncbi:OB-fold domain-containing protein [Pseudonocardia hispaniensis]|uniref:OB-fold domain-containing protein n=1 Tax=Pseudonocardia hispaniensis TaxID=904933 RepID=A0ABW1J0Z9_9PSEU